MRLVLTLPHQTAPKKVQPTGSMAFTGTYSIGERVLVPFTDKNYEAKILKAEFREDGMWYYFVHYNGWNKKYDTWVEDIGLIKMDAGGMAVGSTYVTVHGC